MSVDEALIYEPSEACRSRATGGPPFRVAMPSAVNEQPARRDDHPLTLRLPDGSLGLPVCRAIRVCPIALVIVPLRKLIHGVK